MGKNDVHLLTHPPHPVQIAEPNGQWPTASTPHLRIRMCKWVRDTGDILVMTHV